MAHKEVSFVSPIEIGIMRIKQQMIGNRVFTSAFKKCQQIQK